MSDDTGELFEGPGEMRYEWKISDFTSLKKNEYYQSLKFIFSNACWCLKIFLSRKRYEESEGWVEVYLCRMDCGPAKTLRFTLGLKKADGKEKSIAVMDDTFEAYERHGETEFLQLSELLNKNREFLPLDVLTVTCTLKSVAHQNMESSIFRRLWNLSLSFKDILYARKKTDVVLKLNDGEIPAHRIILESRSAVFNRMFDVDMRETQTGEVNIEDGKKETFEVILSYLYSGEPEELWPSTVCEVYKAAHKYDLRELTKFCVDYMQESLSVDTVADVIALAHFYQETTLKECAKHYFAKHKTEVLKSANWKQFKKENPVLAIEVMEYIFGE